MKKIINKIAIVVMLFSVMLSSCTKGFQEMNTDPNNLIKALPQQLLAPALVSTLTYNMIRGNRNFNNELMQVTVNVSDAEGQVFRYDIRSDLSNHLYNGLYSELTNFKDIYKIASDTNTADFNRSYMGISLICQSWIYSILTDTYGDIPYFQSIQGKDSLNFQPVFDPQKDIYLDIFKKLEEANALLTFNTAITPASDPVYSGNVSRWRKFGNSLYLRLLLRISGKAEVSSQVIAKIKEIVDEKASTYPIIANNAESAILRWTGIAPYSSPYLAVREQDFRGPGIASFFIDNLVNWNDPRIDVGTFGTSNGSTTINRWGIAPFMGAFTGVPSGYAPGQVQDKKSYFYSNTSHVSLQKEPLTGMMMNYAEVKFILAEAALKGWISSSAETHYKEGVLDSITLWLPNWTTTINPSTGTVNTVDAYLIAADKQFLPNHTFDDKMERIHLMKYYALFLVDLQQWFEYRRTGYPLLPKGSGLRNNGVMPARMTYPVYVQSTNRENYQAVIARQGPDLISTLVWWQKP
jgi:hypothetical protein